MASRSDKQRSDKQRSDKPGTGKGSGPGGRKGPGAGSRRTAPVKVTKPFPWGVVASTVLIGAALIGLLVYAAANQGIGAVDPIAEADDQFPGLSVTEDPSSTHVQGAVEYAGYPASPPVGGEHNGLPQQCAVYEEQIPPEHALHSLEHGAVWITYSPDLPAEQVETLADEVEGDPYGLMSPLPGQESPIVLTAWGRQLAVDSADDPAVGRFVSEYTSGPSTPERGASCSGNSTTGSAPAGAPGAPAPGAPAPGAPAPAPAGEAPAPAPTG